MIFMCMMHPPALRSKGRRLIKNLLGATTEQSQSWFFVDSFFSVLELNETAVQRERDLLSTDKLV